MIAQCTVDDAILKHMVDFLFIGIMIQINNNSLQNQWIKSLFFEVINNIDKLRLTLFVKGSHY